MKKLRWVMDGGFWDLDISTPITIDGVARPVPDHPLPLGLSRGTKLSRPKQIDFLQRFMFAPFVPSYAGDKANGGNGLALQRVIAFPFHENWFATVLGQFNIQKFVSSVKDSKFKHTQKLAWVKNIGSHLCDTSLYALGLCSEFFITPDDTLLVSSEKYGDKKSPRYKAVFQHKFPQHNLTVEAACPGLFTDKSSSYWDVPLLVEMDLASISSDSGASYHLCAHHHKGVPKQLDGDQTAQTHAALQPGLCVKSAFSIKKNLDIWRSKEGKLKMVQPFDVFLSDPHLSISGILGTVLTATFGDNSMSMRRKDQSHGINICGPNKSAILADFFATISCTAQHGNFQRLFLDLTRAHARLDFPSGWTLVTGAAHLAHDLYNSKQPDLEAFQAICPKVTLSFQQQIFGEFSFRIDSSLAFDMKNREWCPQVDETIYAVEYALKVLGSAKAVAWYSSKNKEAMVELRFFES